jgi:hypothetical protein
VSTVPTSSEEEGVERIVSKTVEVVKTEQPISIRETRRFSETIAIDHKQKLREMALQFKLPQPRREKSELIVRRESEPKGMKMEVRVIDAVAFLAAISNRCIIIHLFETM